MYILFLFYIMQGKRVAELSHPVCGWFSGSIGGLLPVISLKNMRTMVSLDSISIENDLFAPIRILTPKSL